MTSLATDAAIKRFSENEQRVNDFVNALGSYLTNETPPREVTTLPSFMLDMVARYLAYSLKGNWTTATAYEMQDIVLQSGVAYMCLVAHTAGTFATDLAAGKWAVYQGVTPNALGASSGASLVGFKQPGSDAVATTLEKKAREIKSFQDFGAIADGSQSYADMYAACVKAWNSALTNDHDLFAPAGLYAIGENNFPWRNTEYPTTTLLDCKNITIYGEGPNSLFSTNSAEGADVFNINGLKNFHVRNVGITATLSGTTGAGSNGISVTNGFDNVTLLDIYCFNLPRVDKGYPDGGKALSIQPGSSPAQWGTLKARIIAKGCAYGFDADADLTQLATRKQAVEVDIIAEDCYRAVVYSAGASSGALSEGLRSGIRVRGHAINCQQDVVLSRVHGYDVEMEVLTTKTAAARRLAPDGTPWLASDNVVMALYSGYARNAQIKIVGNKGACDYKARIGGATAGSAGLSGGGSTSHCDIYLDIGGTAAIENINEVDSGGNSLYSSRLYCTTTTTTSVNPNFYQTARLNTIAIGPNERLINPLITGSLNFSYLNGFDSYHSIRQLNGELSFQQKIGSDTGIAIASFLNQADVKKFFIRNDGCLGTAGRGGASAVATIKGILPIYDESNVFWGYVPVYASYTP